MRHADELSTTDPPRFAASGASSREVGTGGEERQVDARKGVGNGFTDLERPPLELTW